MFTVIIAEKSILELFDEFDMFLDPLLDRKKVGFCEWNREGSTLEEMLPDIYRLTEFCSEWRAVIVSTDGLNKVNPFDFVENNELRLPLRKTDWSEFEERRKQRLACFSKAAQNPLTKLTNAFAKGTVYNFTPNDETFERIISGELEFYEYVLGVQLSSVDTAETAQRLRRLRHHAISAIIGNSDASQVIEAVSECDVQKILSLIEPEKVLDLVSLIGENDPLYSDPEYLECSVENFYKAKLLREISESFSFKDKLPSRVFCVAPRTFEREGFEQATAWSGKNDETRYSLFSQWNLYPDINRYIAFDMAPEDSKQYTFDKLRFIGFLLLLAQNGAPAGAVSPARLYRADTVFNPESIERVCSSYLARLKATGLEINRQAAELQRKEIPPLDYETAREVFEKEATVSIDVQEYSRKDLFAKWKKLGLSRDCPSDEMSGWKEQYHSIQKRFTRYLREPRRAVKSAVNGDFRTKNRIDDERACVLNENQLEDVEYKLLEEEEKMVSTHTTTLFNAKGYKEELDKADADIRNEIGRRMTRNTTLAAAGVAILSFIIGFIPLIVKTINTEKSRAFSLIATAVSLALFCLAGLVFLLVKRRRLVTLFHNFNGTMIGICRRIEDGMRKFSQYLSHACNVMREASVLAAGESPIAQKLKVLKYHSIEVDRKISAAAVLFSKYVDCKNVDFRDAEPYNYDFSVMKKYKYEMPGIEKTVSIEYMQPGNKITVNADYIEAVTLTREELYD